MGEEYIGRVENFFAKISVAAIKVEAPLKVGDKIRFESSEPFEQTVESMQVEHESIEEAKKGDSVGIKTTGKAHKGNKVFKVTEE